MEKLSDELLLSGIQQHNHDAFNELFNRYWKKLFKAAMSRLDDEDAAQDVVQEVFISLWQRRETIAIHTQLEAYLLSAVRFSVMSHFRSVKTNELRLQDALQRINILESAIADHTDYYEMEKTLEYEVSHMTETLQKIYHLRTENYSIKDIAAELGLAEQTVKNYISEVLRRLRIAIKEKHPEKYAAYFSIVLALLYK
ncbi:sigma-70 family RNA polymerase sigma factor [Mucilaginibacter sp. CAU 1740]|uniref:RNA polymerase sigma factor n=1 Tax=Mucilaginibacter sp. CAU 1740 TaxID=3140365 RepID=UPI00325B4DB6